MVTEDKTIAFPDVLFHHLSFFFFSLSVLPSLLGFNLEVPGL